YAMHVLALLLAFLSISRPSLLKLVGGIVAYCAFSAVMDFRSAAGIPLIGLLIYLCRRSTPVRFAARVAAAPGGIAIIFVFTGVAITLLNMLLSVVFAHSAEFGFLSPEAVKKYTVQATSDL